jgi:anti-anti-sigma factor
LLAEGAGAVVPFDTWVFESQSTGDSLCHSRLGNGSLGAHSIHTISFSGGLDITRYPEIHDAFLAPGIALAPGSVIIDLSNVSWIDSIFMSEMLFFAKRPENKDRTTVVVAQGSVARMLGIAGIDKKLPVVSTYKTALRYVEKSSVAQDPPEARDEPESSDIEPREQDGVG